MDTSPYEKDAADGIAAISSAMADGKGYTTILKEIVEDLPQPEAAAPADSPAVAPAPAPAAAPSGKPVIKIKHPAIKITTAPKAEEPSHQEKVGGHGKIRIVIKNNAHPSVAAFAERRVPAPFGALLCPLSPPTPAVRRTWRRGFLSHWGGAVARK